MLKWHRPVRFLMAERHGSVPRAILVTRAACLAMDEGAGAAIEKLLEEDAMPASAHGIVSRRECDAALRAALRKRLFVGGWQRQSRPVYACTIRASQDPMRGPATALSDFGAMVLMTVAYFQPTTRGDTSKNFGKEVSRDMIASLCNANVLVSGPRSPTPGAPTYTYVPTKHLPVGLLPADAGRPARH